MDKRFTKESWMNLITGIILGGLLMYLSRNLGELVSAFQLFPLLVIYINEGWKMTLLAYVATLAIGAIFVDPITLAYFGIFMGIATFFVGYMLKNKRQLSNTMIYTAFIKLILMLAFMALAYQITGENPLEQGKALMYESVDKMAETLNKGLDMTPQEVETYLETARAIVDRGIELIPAILFIASYLIAAINIFIVLKVAKGSGKDLGYLTKINKLAPSRELKIASVVVGIISLFAIIINHEYSEVFARNLLYVIFFFYFLDGILLLDFMYERNGNKIARILMPILVLLVARISLLYVVTGFIDMLINFRERMLTSGKK